MIYEIESKNDFSTGASLIVKIPADELDKNALYTILSEKPEFILPLRYRSMDGQIEFVYQVGSLRPLQDFPGTCPTKECAELWVKTLGPFLECGDWFMRPYSFLLDTQYLFFDKDKRTISYVYIPSIRDCCDYADLRVMAVEVAAIVTADDVALENKILRMIMRDFNPKDFLQNLKPYISKSAQLSSVANASASSAARESADIADRMPNNPAASQTPEKISEGVPHAARDIIINLSGEDNSGEDAETDPGGKRASKKKRKKEKKLKHGKDKDDFYNRLKNSLQEEVIIS